MPSVDILVDLLNDLELYNTSRNNYLTVLQDPYFQPWDAQQIEFCEQQIARVKQQIQELICVRVVAVRTPPQQ